ncbi:MAG TPA: SAM-dependent methyltransferase, partial [Blastocatellia bacterium]
MITLDPKIRRRLESEVAEARKYAEKGARQAIKGFAVDQKEAWPAMTPEQQALRRRLRAHGRQLGDRRDQEKGTQTIDRLVSKCAYEHWHRLLFARFLAENDLLVEPAVGVSISLDECRELAREGGGDWLTLASEFAVRMLSHIFRAGDPVLEVALPPETREKLEKILADLPRDVFIADDSLGWVYQFWQKERKEEVDLKLKAGGKTEVDDLSPKTQLFTDDYMVCFLLHNTLGAWWAGKRLADNPELARNAKSEEELRAACGLSGIEWTYLRFVRGDDDAWRPAAGVFDGWPKSASKITMLDPCMGSGHFLVFALPIFVAFRMSEEGLSREEAVYAVLRDNLFGLEIDPRCTQIAAFNLALAAWRMAEYQVLPQPQLACSG